MYYNKMCVYSKAYCVYDEALVGQADSHNSDASLFAQDRTETQEHSKDQPFYP